MRSKKPKRKKGPTPPRKLPPGASAAPQGWGDRMFIAMGHRLRQAVMPWEDGDHMSAIMSFAVVESPFRPDTKPDYLHIEIPMNAARQLGEQLIEFARRVEADPYGRTADAVTPPKGGTRNSESSARRMDRASAGEASLVEV